MEAIDEPIIGGTSAEAPKPRAFSASELVQCEACSRPNPPTRSTCLYCGAALEITELNAFSRTARKDTDASSTAVFHVIAWAPRLDEFATNEVAALLEIKPSDLQSLLTHLSRAPVLVAASEQQAQMAAKNLEARGVTTEVISDEQLALQRAPIPISALEISSDSVVGSVSRSKQTVVAAWDQIALMVFGRLYFETREIQQKRNRTKRVIDEREMLADEAVLDIYLRSDDCGWRIRAGNFDFSCLSANKKLTTFENFISLTSLLRELARWASFDDSYVRVRSALNGLWPAEPTARAKKRRRNAFGDVDSSVTSIDNGLQFTRYSRLVRQLHSLNSKDHAQV